MEEQFYIIWPLLILFFYGYFRRQRNEQQLTYALITVAIVSMALNLYLARVNPKADFYLMPGRAWEFAIGALVFLGRRNGKFRRFHFTLYGYALILISAFVFPTDLAYPGFWALVPCVGAALALADESCPRFLLVRPLQFTGDISYSLYLWHWPILLIGTWAFGHSILTRLVLVILSVGLATITYFAVENPIRRLNVIPYRVFVPSLGLAVFGFLMMNNWYWSAEAMLRDRVHNEIFEAVHFDTPHFGNWVVTPSSTAQKSALAYSAMVSERLPFSGIAFQLSGFRHCGKFTLTRASSSLTNRVARLRRLTISVK